MIGEIPPIMTLKKISWDPRVALAVINPASMASVALWIAA